MVDFIVVVVLVVILGAAVTYMIKAKKKGVKCIGCPEGASCGQTKDKTEGCAGGCSGCGGSCGLHTDSE